MRRNSRGLGMDAADGAAGTQAARAAKAAAAKAKPKPPAESGLAELEKELERQILAEDYEKAAKLRDRIRELKAKKEPG
ncbi:MAG: UvrB/UvrC motif-containing protein [Candidatus Brocadiae bacterium]|nr:UvrB/UvrC motif-containing protein [Candidatus Brocadiia bacterium]